jgi:hypothetical protein
MSGRRGAQRSASDELEVKLAERLEAERLRDRRRRDARVLGDKDMRRWVFDLLEHLGVFKDVTGDVETVYRALGRRSAGLMLIDRLQEHPELFMQGWHEHVKRRTDYAAHVDSVRDDLKRQTEQARTA